MGMYECCERQDAGSSRPRSLIGAFAFQPGKLLPCIRCNAAHPYDKPIFFACPKKMDEKIRTSQGRRTDGSPVRFARCGATLTALPCAGRANSASRLRPFGLALLAPVLGGVQRGKAHEAGLMC